MLFDDLLIHTCELTLPREKYVGDDKWGRPIFEKNEPKTVKCRYMTKKVYVRSSSGADRVIEMSLHLTPDTAVDPQMTVTNIKDDKANMLTTAKLEVAYIMPHYDNRTLHHYKVFLKGAE
ncbi:hypothetical protein ABE945_14295 [Enterococcus gilvus]|uniref:hypothetical protein n=1 Tax=Enterococcus gilvus TaxID=160453 RepID=UPI003D6B397B